jgi:hypothetical protein
VLGVLAVVKVGGLRKQPLHIKGTELSLTSGIYLTILDCVTPSPPTTLRNTHDRMGFSEGWGKALDQLVAYAKTIPNIDGR